MKKIRILYWTFTGLFALAMLFPTIPSVIGEQATVEFITEHLGYPAYFVFYSGIVKLLGLLTIIVPGFPRLKEWAYAGLAPLRQRSQKRQSPRPYVRDTIILHAAARAREGVHGLPLLFLQLFFPLRLMMVYSTIKAN